MTQSTLHSGLTSTLYPHPRNLSPKNYRATYALFPQISEHHPP